MKIQYQDIEKLTSGRFMWRTLIGKGAILTLVLLRGVATTLLTVFALVLKITKPMGKITPATFKFILSRHFSEKHSNLPPTPGVG